MLSGFISASAILIALGQAKTLLGIEMPRTDALHETVILLIENVHRLNPATAAIGLGAVALLLLARKPLARWLAGRGMLCALSRQLRCWRAHPLAAVVTALLTAAAVVAVAGVFRYLPQAVLAAVIIVAVLPLVCGIPSRKY